jgi:hypothetical protein
MTGTTLSCTSVWADDRKEGFGWGFGLNWRKRMREGAAVRGIKGLLDHGQKQEPGLFTALTEAESQLEHRPP